MADSPAFLEFAKSLFGASSTKIKSIEDTGGVDFVVVSSTCLSDIMYDLNTQTLSVTFVDSGSNYSYFGVSQDDYEALVQAGSVGGMYNGIIKYEHGFVKNW